MNFNKQQKGKRLPLDLAHVHKVSDHSNLKTSTPKQRLQRFPILLKSKEAQVKTGHTSENLLNEIRQIIYSLYRAKVIKQNGYYIYEFWE